MATGVATGVVELKLDSHVGAAQPSGCWVVSFSPFTQPVYVAA
ncbi:unannotated protein [freshwater metagenome]|uniref:Unannotated protein n=1 Tax=freshwater metagenome TaxID=449393 RepID=A0A6J7JYE1_9ZZZZ